MESSWGMDVIRSFFAAIDKAIYGLMSTIYQIILDLAGATIFSSETIEDLYTRMYALLGIFMLFKVTFSFINYVINPDSFTDKAKGVQNLVKNAILVLVMIIITPFAFDQLYRAQSAILNDNLIPNFILGVKTSSMSDRNLDNDFSMSNKCINSGKTESDGDYLSLVTLRPFYQIEGGENDEDIMDFSKIENDYCSNESLTPKNYLKSDIYNATKGKVYIVDYKFFLSTIVGIVVCLILVSFCFDIAVRSIKLGFLQMIAPIPIMSYIDPASSKNGMFSKWLKQVGATWASLFIRLIALFFAVLVISKIDISLNSSKHQFWVMLFILIGALMFAKQLPKLLEELIPGLKLGGMQLNPFKKVANEALGGKQLLGAAGAVAGLGIGATAFAGSKLFGLKDFNKKRLEKANSELEEARKEEKDRIDRGLDHTLATRRVWDAMERASQAQAKYNKQQKFFGDMRLKLDSTKDKVGLAIDDHTSAGLRNALYGTGKVASGVSQGIRKGINEAMAGAKEGYNQGSSAKLNPLAVGTKAAKEAAYKEQYPIGDRIKDAATDFFGIKNESGTTSIVKQDIKDKTELLTRINRNIEMMNKAMSDMQTKMGPAEFAKALTTDAKGNYMMNPSYGNSQFKDDLSAIIKQISALESQRLATAKEINKLEKIRDQKPNKK